MNAVSSSGFWCRDEGPSGCNPASRVLKAISVRREKGPKATHPKDPSTTPSNPEALEPKAHPQALQCALNPKPEGQNPVPKKHWQPRAGRSGDPSQGSFVFNLEAFFFFGGLKA